LQTVHALEDLGPMATWTRWKPSRVLCTQHADHSDRPGIEHVVKFRQSPVRTADLAPEELEFKVRTATAALISEVLCGQLLAAGGCRTLDQRLVSVAEPFAQRYNGNPERAYTIREGLHFGTVRLLKVENGPPLSMEQLAELQQVVDLWVFDSWWCNIDRDAEGNTLLARGQGGKFELIGADQSDCFGGAGILADGTWRRVFERAEAAASFEFLQQLLYASGGASALRCALEKVSRAIAQLDLALAAVPAAWWPEAGINPGELRQALEARAGRLSAIVRLNDWEGLDRDLQGGQLL
jgi:hypothetical protein